ncbi:MAG: hypothetical protein CVT95_04970 [Bacteroidetes bacterium HGW-Bacteroidetes-12]|nr:MAG: hypothetical protein CVT95_04970 [Bacteroidetes bacterium HGW-Bacteroidetes-12]
MKKIKKIILICILVAIHSKYKAQNEFDALRYSNIEHFGDARFNAMGGSFGALGANMSALSINPAGLGVYKSSDFSFTPSFHINSTESKSSTNNLGTDGKLNFHIGNIGLVGAFSGSNGWRNVNVTIGYNRISNFNSAISINGKTDNSFLGTYANEINASGVFAGGDIANSFPFSANLGYQTYLINPMVTDSTKFDHVFKDSKNIKQITNIETKGGMGETFFGIGGNFEDKLYIGAIMGITTVRYEFNRTYKETSDASDTLTEFKSFTVKDFVKTSGSGINLKLGMIYSLTDWFRFGLAFHTPTYYSLTDNWDTRVTSEDKLGGKLEERSPLGTFDYVVTTPYRFITSGAFIMNDHGVINVDYEIIDYSTARLREDNNFSGGADFSLENNNIKTNFQTTHNIRVGTEWRLDPFRFRAGYRYMGDPIKSSFNVDNSANIYSVGIGIKQEGYYFDVAYLLKTYKAAVPVVSEFNDFAEVNLNDHYLTFTLGFRF